MKLKINLIITIAFLSQFAYAQNSCKVDTAINNLLHTPGYKVSILGEIPKFVKRGSGTETLILIPGIGFDASVFDDFIKSNRSNYTMYAITIPGFGKTAAPPMPDSSVSYGSQTWSKGVIEGIIKLIESEKIKKPIIVGHFTLGTQLALRMAIDYPTKISGVIVLGGQAKFIAIQNGKTVDYPLKSMIIGTDKYSAPLLFKGKKKKDWDDGNYLPEIYSLNKKMGNRLWKQVAAIPVPVMVRYLCEFTSTDVKVDLDKIVCPVLILRSMFNSTVLDSSVNNYVKPQFIDSWQGVKDINARIEIKDIDNSATFVWKDQAFIVNEEIKKFINTKITK